MKEAVLRSIARILCNSDLSRNRLFKLSSVRDKAIERFVEANELLAKNDYICNTVDLCGLADVDVIIFYGIASDLKWLIKTVKSNPQVILINIPLEPPVVSFFHNKQMLSALTFDIIMVWNDELAEKNVPFVKANIGEAVIYPDVIPLVSFNERRFLVAIYSNKFIKHENSLYGERLKAFDYFSEQPEGLDLYGVGWDKSIRSSILASYQGKCETKKDVLKNYKFSLCFENAKEYPGYITEKIFDCFAAGTVPIYYGAPNVQEYIPNTCFIDFRDFGGYEELYRYLVEMTEAEYQTFLDAVKDFVVTPEYYEFTSKRYAEIILDHIKLVTNETKPNRTVLGLNWALFKIVLN